MEKKSKHRGGTLPLLAMAAAFACAANGAHAQERSLWSPVQPAKPAVGPLEEPIELELDIPRLPPGFQETPAIEPDALLQFLIDGYTGITYQDNVFRADSNKDSDFLWIGSPRLRLIYDGPRVDAEAGLEVEVGRYFDLTEGDYEDFGVSASGVWEGPEDDFARLRGAVGRRHQGIGADISNPERQAAEVTEFWEGWLRFDAESRFENFGAAPDIRARFLDFENADRRNGTEIDNQVKDRVELDGAVRLSYPAGAVWQGVIDPAANARLYRQEDGGTGDFDRDSYGFEPRAGVRYRNESARIDAVLTAGVAHQNYQDSRFDSITAFSMLGALDWYFLNDTRLDLDIERGIDETTLEGAAGVITTRGRVRLVRTFDEFISVGVSGEAETREFEVNRALQAERTDDVFRLGLEANYLFSDIGFAGVQFGYVYRDSTDATVRFDAFEASARVGARF